MRLILGLGTSAANRALSEIHSLPTRLGGNYIAASATNGPCPLSRKHWLEIHQALGLPYPNHQVIPLNVELDTFQRAPYRRRKDFPPYYNGGIVYSPWAAGLGDVWRDHLERIYQLAPHITGFNKKISNQPSLATAIHSLQLQGHGFRLLPDAYHVRWT